MRTRRSLGAPSTPPRGDRRPRRLPFETAQDLEPVDGLVHFLIDDSKLGDEFGATPRSPRGAIVRGCRRGGVLELIRRLPAIRMDPNRAAECDHVHGKRLRASLQIRPVHAYTLCRVRAVAAAGGGEHVKRGRMATAVIAAGLGTRRFCDARSPDRSPDRSQISRSRNQPIDHQITTS
jgi:hypothetical protein